MEKAYKIWIAKENTVFDGLGLNESQDKKDIVVLEGDRAIVKEYDKDNYKVILENINNMEVKFDEESNNYVLVMAKEMFNEKFNETEEKELLQEPGEEDEVKEDDSTADIQMTSGDFVKLNADEKGKQPEVKVTEQIMHLKALYFEAENNPESFEESADELEEVKKQIKSKIKDLELDEEREVASKKEGEEIIIRRTDDKDDSKDKKEPEDDKKEPEDDKKEPESEPEDDDKKEPEPEDDDEKEVKESVQITKLKALYFEAQNNPEKFDESEEELEEVKKQIKSKIDDLELAEKEAVKNLVGDTIVTTAGDTVEFNINEDNEKIIFDTVKEATDIVNSLDENLFPSAVKQHIVKVFDNAISKKIASISERYVDTLKAKIKEINEAKNEAVDSFIVKERENIKDYLDFAIENLSESFKEKFVDNKLVEQAEKNHRELTFVIEKLSRDYNIDMTKSARNQTLESEIGKLKEEIENQRANNILLVKNGLVRDIVEEVDNEILKAKIEKLSENIEFVNAEDYYDKVKMLAENLEVESKTVSKKERNINEDLTVDTDYRENKKASHLDLYKNLI